MANRLALRNRHGRSVDPPRHLALGRLAHCRRLRPRLTCHRRDSRSLRGLSSWRASSLCRSQSALPAHTLLSKTLEILAAPYPLQPIPFVRSAPLLFWLLVLTWLQWLALRRIEASFPAWLVASIAGWLLGLKVVKLLDEATLIDLRRGFSNLRDIAIASIAVGLFYGLLQWLAARKSLSPLWPILMAIGFPLGFGATYRLGEVYMTARPNMGWPVEWGVYLVLASSLPGLPITLLSGVGLACPSLNPTGNGARRRSHEAAGIPPT